MLASGRVFLIAKRELFLCLMSLRRGFSCASDGAAEKIDESRRQRVLSSRVRRGESRLCGGF